MNNIDMECPFCENHFIITVAASFMERYADTVMHIEKASLNDVTIECKCGATFCGEVFVR